MQLILCNVRSNKICASDCLLFCVGCWTAANIAKTSVVWIDKSRFVQVAFRVCTNVLDRFIFISIQSCPALKAKPRFNSVRLSAALIAFDHSIFTASSKIFLLSIRRLRNFLIFDDKTIQALPYCQISMYSVVT